jgi:hypothetical protein
MSAATVQAEFGTVATMHFRSIKIIKTYETVYIEPSLESLGIYLLTVQ